MDSTSNSSWIALAGSALYRLVGVAAKACKGKGYSTMEGRLGGRGLGENGGVKGKRDSGRMRMEKGKRLVDI